MNLPNCISLARLLAVPLIVWLLLTDAWAAAFTVFVLAGVSDAIDGYIATRMNQRSLIGAYLDPLADKALLVSIYLALGIMGEMPYWLVILVVSRDLLIVGGALMLFVLKHDVRIEPSRASKANTALQIAYAALTIGALAFGPWLLAEALSPLAIAVGVSTVVSGAGYLLSFARRLTAMEGGR